MKNEVLLLEDVHGVGRSGDIVSVKPGFSRNYLFPKKIAIRAEKHLVRLQDKLKEERAKRAIVDKKEAEDFAKQLEGKTIVTEVKIDAEGHMYGSVSISDILKLLKEQLGITLERRNLVVPKPFKELGDYLIELRLKEGVPAKIRLDIKAEAPASA